MISLAGLMGDSVKLGKMNIKLGQVVSNPFVNAFAPTNEGEDVKTKEGGDHEVFMAQSTLDSIIKAATELKGKVGEKETDIPAWIQDHITNSENYISQANTGYYKNESVNEGRSLKSLAKEYYATQEQIEGYVQVYKRVKGTPDEKKIIDRLKKLNSDKKELEKRMHDEVSGLYKDAELKIQD